MKYFFFVIILSHLASCMTYKPITNSNIKTVYVLFKDSSWHHYDGYKLFDGSIVKWDKKNANVKIALNNYKIRTEKLPTKSSNYLKLFLLNKKIIKYVPIKVSPLKEFGIIETTLNEFILYGIMGNKVFIDLTWDKVYY